MTLEQAVRDLQNTIEKFNKHMSDQIVRDIELKKQLNQTRHSLEELLNEQDQYNHQNS